MAFQYTDSLREPARSIIEKFSELRELQDRGEPQAEIQPVLIALEEAISQYGGQLKGQDPWCRNIHLPIQQDLARCIKSQNPIEKCQEPLKRLTDWYEDYEQERAAHLANSPRPNASLSDIFLSYANEDRAWAGVLAEALGETGWTVFWDRTIPPGLTWRDYIGAELQKARCVVVVWSETSIASRWVIEEAEEGDRRDILIPVLLEDVLPPLGLRSMQATDLSGWNREADEPVLKRLVKGLERLLGPVPRLAEAQPKAPAKKKAISKKAPVKKKPINKKAPAKRVPKKSGIPSGYRKAQGVTWGQVGTRGSFEIDTRGDKMSGVFYRTFALTSDQPRQPTKLLVLCSDPVKEASAFLEHVIPADFPLTTEVHGEKAVKIEFAEYVFGPIPTEGLNGQPKAPIQQPIHLTVGFEMSPPEKRRNEILEIYERA